MAKNKSQAWGSRRPATIWGNLNSDLSSIPVLFAIVRCRHNALSSGVRNFASDGELGSKNTRTIPQKVVTPPRIRKRSFQVAILLVVISPTPWAMIPERILATAFPVNQMSMLFCFSPCSNCEDRHLLTALVVLRACRIVLRSKRNLGPLQPPLLLKKIVQSLGRHNLWSLHGTSIQFPTALLYWRRILPAGLEQRDMNWGSSKRGIQSRILTMSNYIVNLEVSGLISNGYAQIGLPSLLSFSEWRVSEVLTYKIFQDAKLGSVWEGGLIHKLQHVTDAHQRKNATNELV